MGRRNRLAVALASVAVAAMIAAPGALAKFEMNPAPSCPAVAAPEVAPPPSSIAASAGRCYDQLRAAHANNHLPAPQPVAVVETPAFDWGSAAIGAIAAAGLLLMVAGVRRRVSARAPAIG